MLNCKQVTHIVATGEIDELTWLKRIEMRFHLMMCKHCREYMTQLLALGRGARRLFGFADDPETLARLENKIMADSGCNHGNT